MLLPCAECGYPNVLTLGLIGQVGIGHQQTGAGDQSIGLENRLMESRIQLMKVGHQLISIR